MGGGTRRGESPWKHRKRVFLGYFLVFPQEKKGEKKEKKKRKEGKKKEKKKRKGEKREKKKRKKWGKTRQRILKIN